LILLVCVIVYVGVCVCVCLFVYVYETQKRVSKIVNKYRKVAIKSCLVDLIMFAFCRLMLLCMTACM